MANTLDLDPEWGAIDLIEEVETAFGIKVAHDEAERCWTVGDLYEAICAHTRTWDEQDGSCASSAVFYRLRRALAPEDKATVSPTFALNAAGMSPRRLFKTLGRETNLRLPIQDATLIGSLGVLMWVVGFIGGLAALFSRDWAMSGMAALVVTLGVLLLRIDPGRLPVGVATVGDLVRRTVPLNAQNLADTGVRPPDRWTIFVALAAEHGSLPTDQIGPDTFLLRRGMELAARRG